MSLAPPPAALLEVTAEVVAAGPVVRAQFDAGLRGLIRLLGADRGDSDFVATASPSYRPSHLASAPDASVAPFEVPLDDPLVQSVLAAPAAFLITDVRDDLADGPVRDLLIDNRTRSIIVQRLGHNDDGCGLVCIDWVDREADVSTEAVELVDFFVTHIWTPLLLRAAVEGARTVRTDALATLTTAERAVADLAAAGLSYREIASCRATSINTVGQQLRSARGKVEARNTAELCALVRSAAATEPPRS